MAVYPSSLPVRHENLGDIAVNLLDKGNSIIANITTMDVAYGTTTNLFPVAGKFETSPTTYHNNDATPFLTDVNGRLQVTLGPTAAVFVDDALFTTGTDKVMAIGCIYDDVATDVLDENDIGLPRCTAKRSILTLLDDGDNRLAVVLDGEASVQPAGTDGGIVVAGIDPANNYQFLKVDTAGALYVNTGKPGTLVEDAQGPINVAKGTPIIVCTHTPGAPEEILGFTYAGSGKAQVDLFYGVTISEVRMHTFYTSTANPNVQFTFPQELELTTTDTIYVYVTNLEKAVSPTSDFDAYATIQYTIV